VTDPAIRELAERAGVAEALMEQALEWQVALWSGEAGAEQSQKLERWRAEHPDHERAWRHVERLAGRLDAVPAGAAAEGLREAGRAGSRRRFLKTLGLAGVVGTAGYLASTTPLVRVRLADLRTAVGEIRAFDLPDGSRLTLNTATGVNIDFTDTARRIELVAGEILVETAPDSPTAEARRPLRVQTRHGRLQPVGTRFTVLDAASGTELAVIEGRVEVQPSDAAARSVTVEAGQRVRFTTGSIEPLRPKPDPAAWVDGRLVVEQMPLGEFIETLDRYHPGFLRCRPEAAELRVSGTFSVADTEQTLQALQRALPIRIERRTRLWVTVQHR